MLKTSELAETRRLLAAARHVSVVGHVSPDGDCVGAMLALRLGLQQLEVACTLVLPDAATDALAFLPGASEILVRPESLPACDLIIVPDCGDLGRLGEVYEQNRDRFTSVPVLNIDHHVSNPRFGAVNIVDAAAAAVCEQLFFLFDELGVQIDAKIATCLLTGIITDTQTFRTPSTTPRVLKVASLLTEAGAPIAEIADRVYNTRSLASLRLWGLALAGLKERDGIVWARLNGHMLEQAGATWDESEALVNLLSSVRPAAVAILFKEHEEGIVKVSLRSPGLVNVAAIAAEFGGGGHFGAAGCSLATPVELAEAAVIERILEALAPGKRGEPLPVAS